MYMLYIYIYVCIHIHIYVCDFFLNIYTYIRIYIHVYSYIYKCIYVYTYKYTYIYIFIYTYISVLHTFCKYFLATRSITPQGMGPGQSSLQGGLSPLAPEMGVRLPSPIFGIFMWHKNVYVDCRMYIYNIHISMDTRVSLISTKYAHTYTWIYVSTAVFISCIMPCSAITPYPYIPC